MSEKFVEKRDINSAPLRDKVNPALEDLVSPHVDSFNALVENPNSLLTSLRPAYFKFQDQEYKLSIGKITISQSPRDPLGGLIFPRECRELGTTYATDWKATLVVEATNGSIREDIDHSLGRLPVMLKSVKCNLSGLSPKKLVAAKEDANEVGGYFIINGKERLIRMQLSPRRNYAIALRKNFGGLPKLYTNLAITMRCARKDGTAVPIFLHYKTTGDVDVRFWIGPASFLLPLAVVLKALVDTTDREIYEKTLYGNNFHKVMDISEEVQSMLQRGKFENGVSDNLETLNTRVQCLQYMGHYFRTIMRAPESLTDEEVGELLIQESMLVHLGNHQEKYECFIFMLQKLYALAKNKIQAESLDSMLNHEVLLPGQALQSFIVMRLQTSLKTIAGLFTKLFVSSEKKKLIRLRDGVLQSAKLLDDVGARICNFLSTGNFPDSFEAGLREKSGYCIVAERINYYRFLAHFRSIHRGSSFQELRTTASRKLLPETWGFLCPVHTPDGGPCGLLNHVASPCKVVAKSPNVIGLPAVLASLGMVPISAAAKLTFDHLSVLLDGKVIGKVPIASAPAFANKLRLMKVHRDQVPETLEIALLMPATLGLYPGVYLYSQSSRMYRPVRHLATGLTEYIGPFEQAYMDIACLDEDIKPGITTHQEIHPTNMFSIIADMTPFSDFNQSPRNMYQCQMAKQTMAIPCHNYPNRVEKMFRIQTPQKPIVKTRAHDAYDTDDYPTGTNSIVAVLSYTGFDMEDGMIICRDSIHRGYQHGSLYKIVDLDLEEGTKKTIEQQESFSNPPDNRNPKWSTDEDGFCHIGTRLNTGKTMYITKRGEVLKEKAYKNIEAAYVDEVRIFDTGSNYSLTGVITKASIKLRFNRNPVIGDKFSSRHGQKGTLSRLWPQVDMPFSESGLTPDVIINPNAFPSRMTIGMLVESMAGKAGALHGITQDGSPFRFNEKDTAVNYFGEQLVKAGYNYYGNEVMYSGTTGEQFAADIYIGCVYYQRLRHMVKDKFQARATGGVDQLTKQPLKGRKVGGGIRFGEMERDCLIAHGAAFLLNDRLFSSSDQCVVPACRYCGSLMSIYYSKVEKYCTICKSEDPTHLTIPAVLRYLVAELLSCNVKCVVHINDGQK